MKIPSARTLRPIAKRYCLRLIVLFGSQVTGRLHPESDVDVAVWAEESIKFDRRLDLWLELSTAFQADIDLSVLNHAEPLLLFQVASKGRALFESKRGAWSEFKSYAARYYADTQHLRDALDRALRRRIKSWRHG